MRRLMIAPLFAALVALSLVTVPGTPARAQSTSALISERLDELVQLQIETKTPLPQVMSAIADRTGVPIEADPAVWDLLPWGEQTAVAATFQDLTLRDALQALTRELGLTFAVTEQAVEVRPMPPLRRLGRRSTIEEISVLKLLDTTPAGLSTERPTVTQVLETVDAQLQAAGSAFAVENRAFDATTGDQPVPVARNFTLAEALEAVHRATGATWYPWGDTVVVVPKADHVRTQLNKTITTRFHGTDLSQVLAELSRRAGVPFNIEPGALQRVPPELRTVNLMLDSTPIRQALDNIGGFTGLGYVVNDEGVYVWNQSAGAGAAGSAVPRDRIFGLLELENGLQVAIPQSQVPPDVQEYLRHKAAQAIDDIRQQMQDEGFVPTTQPAPASDEPQDL